MPLNHPVGWSGTSFVAGKQFVLAHYGYAVEGNNLIYAVIRSWPIDAPPESRLNDPRFDLNPGGLPAVRHSDGHLKEVATDGRVYVFFGEHLRTMRVGMNEVTDMGGVSQQKDIDGIWDYLTQFQVAQ